MKTFACESPWGVWRLNGGSYSFWTQSFCFTMTPPLIMLAQLCGHGRVLKQNNNCGQYYNTIDRQKWKSWTLLLVNVGMTPMEREREQWANPVVGMMSKKSKTDKQKVKQRLWVSWYCLKRQRQARRPVEIWQLKKGFWAHYMFVSVMLSFISSSVVWLNWHLD